MNKNNYINEIKQIEIRSNDVQEILGIIPHWIIRFGISLIFSVIILLLIGSWFFKYPEVISLPINIKLNFNNNISNYKYKFYGELEIPEIYWGCIKEGQNVNIKLTGYSYHDYGIIRGLIFNKEETRIKNDKYILTVSFPNDLITNYNKNIQYYNNMSGIADIIISEKRIIENILSPIMKIL